ncbi:polysaccharide pyruvyl transferase family protein [Vallitalea sp.]|jgi:polysaccharide pyruvyl transferase WcaK-like protein|uniref:polysaccharide pyruvyl transferase family protein n=1 Tax=Vallitalea sp. TaxID=1882829 RepID=UPI0025E34385|nr:polysaccharide pyruvyl transferase family protein [Vallitalea sp.]MCT4686250.1 polysaccharide pyruvyl transferase family protein [Vallitalea sp.]
MCNNFLIYGHGGAYNHGAEAIVKCTVNLIKNKYPESEIILSTHFKEQDIEFDMPVDEYCERDFHYVSLDKNTSQKGFYDTFIYKSTIERIKTNTICLSVGGDNYCYDNWHRWKTIHDIVIQQGAKSILWSCSIEPSMISKEMVNTLRTHHLITVRERLTYNALIEKGLDNVELCSDVAFLLHPKKTKLPENFIVNNTVAINISPLVVRRELIKGSIVKNINTLIEYIINNTDMNIALIPHVVMPMDNDFLLLQKIYNKIELKDRICLISDKLNVAEYKYIISKCRFGIFARTHATISAYSSSIPTIAIGYSVKSKGIALDLGLEDFVLPINNFLHNNSLLLMFKMLLKNENNLKQILVERIDAYNENAKCYVF